MEGLVSMDNLRNLLKVISSSEFTYNIHSSDNSILRYLTSEKNYKLDFYLELNKIYIVGVNFDIPFHYSTRQIGLMFEDENFEKRWIHCPLILYERFIIDVFKEDAYKFLDECKERGYEV